MPPNTLPEMILGFAVILGILLIYVFTLIIRTHKAKSRRRRLEEE
jgi:competence protein ComGF